MPVPAMLEKCHAKKGGKLFKLMAYALSVSLYLEQFAKVVGGNC